MKKIIILLFVFINSFLFSQSNGALNIQYLGDNKDKGIPYRYGTSGPFFSDSVYFSEDGFLYIFQVDGILRKYDMNMNVVYSIDLIEKDKRVFWIRQNWARAIVKNNKIYVLVCPTEDSGRGLLVFSMSGELLYEKMGGFVGIDQAVSNGFEVSNNTIIYLGTNRLLYSISLEDIKKNNNPKIIENMLNMYPVGYKFHVNNNINNKLIELINKRQIIWYKNTLYNGPFFAFVNELIPTLNGIDTTKPLPDGIYKEINTNEIKKLKATLSGKIGLNCKYEINICYFFQDNTIVIYLFNNDGSFIGKYSGKKPSSNETIFKCFVYPNGDIMFWAEYIPEGENQGSNNIRMRYYKIPNTWDPIPDATVQTYLDGLKNP